MVEVRVPLNNGAVRHHEVEGYALGLFPVNIVHRIFHLKKLEILLALDLK